MHTGSAPELTGDAGMCRILCVKGHAVGNNGTKLNRLHLRHTARRPAGIHCTPVPRVVRAERRACQRRKARR